MPNMLETKMFPIRLNRDIIDLLEQYTNKYEYGKKPTEVAVIILTKFVNTQLVTGNIKPLQK